MSDWLEESKFLRWNSLENLADNQISKVVGLIPIAGYLIIFNDSLVETLSFNAIVGHRTNLDSPFLLESVSKLRLTFFGSILLFLGNRLFVLMSPKVLTICKDDFHFADRVCESYSLREIQSLENSVFEKNYRQRTPLLVEDEQNSSFLKSDRRPARGHRNKKHLFREYSEYVRAVSREWWVGQMHTGWLARRLVFVLCLLGYLMLALPALDISQAVIRDLVKM